MADCSVRHPPVRVAVSPYCTLRLVFKAVTLWACVSSHVHGCVDFKGTDSAETLQLVEKKDP